MNSVFRVIIKSIKNDKPRRLRIHWLKIFPKSTKGTKLQKMKNNGIISVNNKAIIEYVIANNNFARGSKLCKNDFFFINLKAFKNCNDNFKEHSYIFQALFLM